MRELKKLFAFRWYDNKFFKKYDHKNIPVYINAVDENGEKYNLTYYFQDYFLLWSNFDPDELLKKYFSYSYVNCHKLESKYLNTFYTIEKVSLGNSNYKNVYVIFGSKIISKFFTFNPNFECDVCMVDNVVTKARLLLFIASGCETAHTSNILKIKNSFEKIGNVNCNRQKSFLDNVFICKESFNYDKLDYWCFDIEVAPDVTTRDYLYRFPNGFEKGDKIVMISVVKKRNREKIVFYWGLGEVSNVKEYTLIHCKSELDTILQFLMMIENENPLYIMGYNIYLYDIPCIVARLYFLKGEVFTSKIVKSYQCGMYHIPIILDVFFLDYYYFVINFSGRNISSKKLNDVAFYKLGIKKVDIEILSIHRIYQDGMFTEQELNLGMETMDRSIWRKQCKGVTSVATPLECLYYCGVDSDVCFKCHEHDKVFESLYTWSNFIHMNFLDLLLLGKSSILAHIMKIYVFLNCNVFFSSKSFADKNSCFLQDNPDMSIKNATKYDNAKSQFKGGFNYCQSGIYKNICSLDYDSEYPNVIISFNLSPETVTCVKDPTKYLNNEKFRVIPYESHDDGENSEQTYDNFFPVYNNKFHTCAVIVDKTNKGVIPLVVEKVVDERFKQKKLFDETGEIKYDHMQYFLKILANSLYGIMGAQKNNTQLSSFVVAMCTALSSRYAILYSSLIIKHNNLDAIIKYYDTDGFHVICSKSSGELICKLINKRYEELGYGRMKIKFEGFFKEGMYLSKKNYVLFNDKAKASGFEKSAQPFVKRIFEYCFELIQNKKRLTTSNLIIKIIDNLEKEKDIYKKTKVKELVQYSTKVNSPSVKLINKLNSDGINVQSGEQISNTFYILDIDEKESLKLNPFPVSFATPPHDIDIFKVISAYQKAFQRILSVYNEIPLEQIEIEWQNFLNYFYQKRFKFYLEMIQKTVGSPIELYFFGSINYTFKKIINFH